MDAINGAILRLYTVSKREDGQTFVEYSLIGVLIAVALVAALGVFEGKIEGALTTIGGKL
ncbi:MAG TPA: Flp family type IVb pilin [Gaiellaceae bacterium]|nr:Flp family type IVb pilin [Gaiellaceae bacterium]